METKWCYHCSAQKPLTSFSKNKSKKDGLADECLDCKRHRDREYVKKHREEARKRASEWFSANKHDPVFMERFKENQKRYQSKIKHKHAATQAKRRASKLLATPKWLSEAQLKDIQTEYALRDWCSKVMGIEFHVDHIVPLKGEEVCGLHVPWNLRVIPAKVNLTKGNKHVV